MLFSNPKGGGVGGRVKLLLVCVDVLTTAAESTGCFSGQREPSNRIPSDCFCFRIRRVLARLPLALDYIEPVLAERALSAPLPCIAFGSLPRTVPNVDVSSLGTVRNLSRRKPRRGHRPQRCTRAPGGPHRRQSQPARLPYTARIHPTSPAYSPFSSGRTVVSTHAAHWLFSVPSLPTREPQPTTPAAQRGTPYTITAHPR